MLVLAKFQEILSNASKLDGWAEEGMATWGERGGKSTTQATKVPTIPLGLRDIIEYGRGFNS